MEMELSEVEVVKRDGDSIQMDDAQLVAAARNMSVRKLAEVIK